MRGPKRIVQLPSGEISPTRIAKLLGVSRQRAHQLLNLEKHYAREALKREIESGRITRPKTCEKCGKKTSNVHAHHYDYSKKLEVNWLCSKCHALVHPHYKRSVK